MNRPPASERALRQLHRVLILDGHHPGADLDPVDLPERDGKHGEKVWLVRHLGHPDAPETLFLGLREVLHGAVHRRTSAAQRAEETDLHGTLLLNIAP